MNICYAEKENLAYLNVTQSLQKPSLTYDL